MLDLNLFIYAFCTAANVTIICTAWNYYYKKNKSTRALPTINSNRKVVIKEITTQEANEPSKMEAVSLEVNLAKDIVQLAAEKDKALFQVWDFENTHNSGCTAKAANGLASKIAVEKVRYLILRAEIAQRVAQNPDLG